MGVLAGSVKKFFANMRTSYVRLYFVGGSFVGFGRLFGNLFFTLQTIPESIGLFLVILGKTMISTFLPFHKLAFSSLKAFLLSIGIIALWTGLKIAVGSLIWTKRWYDGMKAVLS